MDHHRLYFFGYLRRCDTRELVSLLSFRCFDRFFRSYSPCSSRRSTDYLLNVTSRSQRRNDQIRADYLLHRCGRWLVSILEQRGLFEKWRGIDNAHA